MELDKRKALAEMREKHEIEKSRSILELKLEIEKEKQQAVEATKKTQWVIYCSLWFLKLPGHLNFTGYFFL